MDLVQLRDRIDELDRRLVELLNERADCVVQIGQLKRAAKMPIYEPERERQVHDNVCRVNSGPLNDNSLLQVYERIIDVMRNVQKEEIAPGQTVATDAELPGEME